MRDDRLEVAGRDIAAIPDRPKLIVALVRKKGGSVRDLMQPADSSSSRSGDAIREEARTWFLRLLERPTSAHRAGFEAWLNADSAHREAYQATETAWLAAEGASQRLAETEKQELAVYLDAMDKAKGRRKALQRTAAFGLAVLAFVGGAAWLEQPHLIENMVADYATDRGERRSLTLPDGSTVILDADSALALDFTTVERRVRLLRGGAFFEVADGATPFLVEAEDALVRDIGTGFDVRLEGDGGVVTLEHGRVSVETGQQTHKAMLEPGEQVRFGERGLDAVQNVELADALAWREGRLVFYRARLGDVVDTIGRYRKGRIFITSAALADERVTGSFKLSDTQAALASLQASVGFQLHSLGERITVISR